MVKLLTTSLTIAFLFLAISASVVFPEDGMADKNRDIPLSILYDKLGLDKMLEFSIFKRAAEGVEEYEFSNNRFLTIIDYTKASDKKRLFVIDLDQQKVLFNTLVAHGKNSGVHYVTDFSNESCSLMSSQGFYRTAETYTGKHGYSLRLDGLEEGINDQARERLIVIHGAHYVSDAFIKKHGRIGRSWGCPALPPHLSKEVIDLIKGGSCLYIHGDDDPVMKEISQ
ncbi:MAG: murein L,D-transpeptidase catalytic domain family protein [Bacteroidota bacterium]